MALDGDETPRGAPKKEAFHRAAEDRIVSFRFEKPAAAISDRQEGACEARGHRSCRASVQVLNNGGEKNLHHHPTWTSSIWC